MLCRCGRDLKLLNEASSEPKCQPCGYISALCRCAPLGEEGE
jgi:hypothetical protein